MKGMFLGVRVYKLKKPILLGTNIVALLAFCLVTGVILASGGVKVKKPEAAKAEAPEVVTDSAVNTNNRTAILSGTQLDSVWFPNHFDDTYRGFEYGIDTNYGNTLLDSSSSREGYELVSISNESLSLNNPGGSTNCNGVTYVADTNNNRIVATDENLINTIKTFGEFGEGNGQFKYPKSVSCFNPYPDSTFLLVSDSGNNRIQVLNISSQSNPDYLTYFSQWGSQGSELGQFNNPTGITTNRSAVYIVDTDNNRIQSFEYFGSNAKQWNNSGDLNIPYGIAYSDVTNRLYVTDSGNNRAISFDIEGNEPIIFGNTSPWAPSSATGKFNNPTGIAVDKYRNIYIADTNNNRFQKFYENTDNSISFINVWDNPPDGFSSPTGIFTLDYYAGTKITVSDSSNNKILAFSISGFFPTGSFSAETHELDCSTTYHYRAFTRETYPITTEKFGEDKTFVSAPCDLVVSNKPATDIRMTSANINGEIVLSNSPVALKGFAIIPKDHPERVSIIDADTANKNLKFKYMQQLGQTQLNQPNGLQGGAGGELGFLPYFDYASLTANEGNNEISYCEPSTGICKKFIGEPDVDLNSPKDIACQFDPSFSNVFPYINSACYITDSGNDRIVKIFWNYETGLFEISYFGEFGNENGQFNNPTGITVDSKGNIYIADTNNNRVQKFDSSGSWIETIGGSEPGSNVGQFDHPKGVEFDFNKNRLLISDTNNHRIQQLDQNGIVSVLAKDINLNKPEGINAGGRDNNIYIADTGNDRIIVINSEGLVLGTYGSTGNGNGEFISPKDISITTYPYFLENTDSILGLGTQEFLYVSDSGNNRIQTIAAYNDPSSSEIFSKKVTGLDCNTTYSYVAFAGNQTSFTPAYQEAYEDFTTSQCGMDIETNPAENITKTIATFNGNISQSSGQIKERGFQYGLDNNYGNTINDSPNQASITSLINYKDLGHSSINITTDYQGNVYTSDLDNCKIIKYDSNLNEQTVIDVGCTIDNDLALTGIDVDNSGYIYALTGKGINKYSPSGELVSNLASDFITYGDIEVDSQGNIYLGLFYFGQGILKLDSNGNLIDWIINPQQSFYWFFYFQNNSLALDSEDNLLTYNWYTNQVTKINTENGNIIAQYKASSSIYDSFLGFSLFYLGSFSSFSVDSTDNIYIQNPLNGIQKYNSVMKPIQNIYIGSLENCLANEPILWLCSNISIDKSNNVFTTNGNLMLKLGQSSTFPEGAFAINNNQLLNCTTYHYRAFGKNLNIETGTDETFYGNDQSFTTDCPGGGGGGNGGGGGSTTPLSEAPPTTTGAGFVPGTNKPKNTPGSSNPIANVLRSLPRGVAAALPYILLAFLIVLAVLYAIQSYREFQSTKRLNALINKYQALQYGGKNFVTLTSHYLNTPIGIMQFSSELLVSLGLLTAAGASKVSSSIKNIKDSVLDLLKKNSETTEQIMQDVDKQLVDSKVRNAALQPAVWVPLLVAALLLIATNVIFIYARLFSLSLGSLAVQIALFVLCTTLLILAFRSLARNRYVRKQRQALIDAEQKLMDTKKEFIDKTIQALESDIKELKAISASFKSKKQAEPFMRGLAMIVSVESSFALLNKFAGYQPMGSTNSNDVNEVLNNIITRNDKAIKDKGLNIAQNIDGDLQLGLDKDALIVLLSSTIGNAIKFSNNDGSVEINIKKRINDVIITIQDNGLGIAKDKLDTLMMPFTRATDVMKYDYEGIGLGLYMDRIILEQIDGSIKLASAPGNGTTVRMKIPNNGLAETSPITNTANSPLSPNPEVRPA